VTDAAAHGDFPFLVRCINLLCYLLTHPPVQELISIAGLVPKQIPNNF